MQIAAVAREQRAATVIELAQRSTGKEEMIVENTTAQVLQIVPHGVSMHPLLTQIRRPLQTIHTREAPRAVSSRMLAATFDGCSQLVFPMLTIGISTSSSSRSNDTETDVLDSVVVIVIDSAPTITSVTGPWGITSIAPSGIRTLYPLT
jgi:hypothetical protein